MDILSCFLYTIALQSPVLSVYTGIYIILLDQISCGCISLCNSVDNQVCVQMEMGILLAQVVPSFLYPQGFSLFSLISGSGPACVICPLSPHEWFASSLYHLDMTHFGQGCL